MQVRSLEQEMATHSSILAWKNSVGRGACWATVHGAADSDMNDQLSILNINVLSPPQKGKSCQT